MKRLLAALLSAVLVMGLLAGCSEPAAPEDKTTDNTPPAQQQEKKEEKKEVPGVTDTTVKVGGFAAQSGPVGVIGISVRKGFEAYIKHVNEGGGVHGRKIDVVNVVDDGFDGGKAMIATQQLVESDKVFALAPVLGTPGFLASYDYMVESGVPVVYPMTGVAQTAHPPQKNIFAVQPNYLDEAKVLTQYAVEELGAKKIAVFWQNSDMGKQGMEGIREILPDLGGELVYDAPHEAKSVDFATPVLNAKQKGAEAVIVFTTLAEAVGIAREAQKQGLEATLLTSYVNADPINLPKLAGEAAVGMIAGGWVPVADPNDPDIQKFYEIYGTYNKTSDGQPEVPNAFSTAGFIAAELLVKGLEDAGPDLTREGFIAALESLKGWNGIMAKNITYGPDERAGVKAFYLNKVIKDDQGNVVMVPISEEPYMLR